MARVRAVRVSPPPRGGGGALQGRGGAAAGGRGGEEEVVGERVWLLFMTMVILPLMLLLFILLLLLQCERFYFVPLEHILASSEALKNDFLAFRLSKFPNLHMVYASSSRCLEAARSEFRATAKKQQEAAEKENEQMRKKVGLHYTLEISV